MIKDFITEEKDGLFKVNGAWCSKSFLEHLHEVTINNKPMLLEYYRRYSSEQDNRLLGGWSVWIYGNDRENNPPHCHLILGNPKNPDMNIELHLHDLEVYHMEIPTIKNITWNDVDAKLKSGFFEWLRQPSKTHSQITNLREMLIGWDGENTSNTLSSFIKRSNLSLDNLHPWVKEELVGKSIDIGELISSIFEILLPIYQSDKEQREILHNIENPIELARIIGLPFEFNDYNVTSQVKDTIKKYEEMCYNMTIN